MNAPTRLGSAQGFVASTAKPFANTVADILANKIFNPLRIDENGADVTAAAISDRPSSLTVLTGTAQATDGRSGLHRAAIGHADLRHPRARRGRG